VQQFLRYTPCCSLIACGFLQSINVESTPRRVDLRAELLTLRRSKQHRVYVDSLASEVY